MVVLKIVKRRVDRDPKAIMQGKNRILMVLYHNMTKWKNQARNNLISM